MSTTQQIISQLQELTQQKYVAVLTRGNAAIFSALHAVQKEVLIPEDGGWITYHQYPKKLKLKLTEVQTDDAIINLDDLKLKAKKADALLYHHPGGYFAEQPLEAIYRICKKRDCLVILDISGSIGTLQPIHADIIIGSFGRWKLVDAKAGGFLATNNQELFQQLRPTFKLLDNETKLKTILKKINQLPKRIKFLTETRNKIIKDLKQFNIIHPDHLGFVVIIKHKSPQEKEKLINYCNNHHLDYTECPRYIRINQPAISIEVKRL